MDIGAFIARAFVYPMARAFFDAWYEARAKYDIAREEFTNDTDHHRADKFRNAVRSVDGLQSIPDAKSDPKSESPAPGSK